MRERERERERERDFIFDSVQLLNVAEEILDVNYNILILQTR